MKAARGSAADAALSLAGARRIGLGCMALTGIYGRVDRPQAVATLREALDRGIRLYDTAPLYGDGANEALLGEVVHPATNAIIVTKFGLFANADGRLQRDSSPLAIRKSVEDSLRRLRLERIDLLLQHRADPQVPAEAVSDTVSDLITEGKVAAFGLSAVSAGDIAAWKGPPALAAVQNELSVVAGKKREEVECAEALGMVYIAFSPLGRGLLAGTVPNRDGDIRKDMPSFTSPDMHQSARIADLREEAKNRGISSAALAVRWTLDCGPAVVAIPGCRSASQVRELLRSVDQLG